MCEIVANLIIESIESAIDIAGNSGQVCGKVASGEVGPAVEEVGPAVVGGAPGALGVWGVLGALVGPAADA